MNISGKKIEIILARKCITKLELAKRSGTSHQNICTIVRRGSCHPATAGKLAKALGVDVEEIICD